MNGSPIIRKENTAIRLDAGEMGWQDAERLLRCCALQALQSPTNETKNRKLMTTFTQYTDIIFTGDRVKQKYEFCITFVKQIRNISLVFLIMHNTNDIV